MIPPLTDRQRLHIYRRESLLRDACHRYLAKLDHAQVIKMHGSAFSKAGVPDTLLVWRGLAVWFEWKVPGGKVSKIQEVRMRRLEHCLSRCFVCSTLGDVEAALIAIIREGHLQEPPL